MRPRQTASEPVTALARAKLNLCLHVTGRRPDGYHMLDSLVVFPDIGDRVTAEPARRLSLTLTGPFAAGLDAGAGNLVIRAAQLMPGCTAALLLEKNLPVAAGIGGGSADAAATLRALAECCAAPMPDAAAVLTLGADVPVCLDGRPARMRGIGEVLDPLPPLSGFWTVLVNPMIACPTQAVFSRLEQRENPALADIPHSFPDADTLFAWLRGTRNDLEPPAIELVPRIGDAIAALAAAPGCGLARMSGSGATSFGLFARAADALDAATRIRAAEPGWWVAAAGVG